MRILLIHQYFKDEGEVGGTRWNEMIRIWTEQGHEVTVLCGMLHSHIGKKPPAYKGKWVVKKQQGKVEAIRCHVSESYNSSFLGRLWAYFSFMFASIFGGLFYAKGKYDVIVVSSPPLFVGMSAYIISLAKRTPFVFEIRDLWPESAIDTGVLKNKFIIKLSYWFEAFIYKKASLINVLTSAFEKALIEKKSVPKDKIIYIPNASDFTFSDELLVSFDPKGLRKQLGVDDKFVVIYVGAHGVANHLDQILETADVLRDTRVQFVLVGDGMQKPKLKKMKADMKLNNVLFLDPVTKQEVIKYILAADMGASVLKRVDTFKTIYSNKTFDYLSCKKPIFMAIDGVSRELIQQANGGVYVEPENPQDFAEKIKYYMQNLELIEQQGEEGYRYAKANFDRQTLALQYLKILNHKFNN